MYRCIFRMRPAFEWRHQDVAGTLRQSQCCGPCCEPRRGRDVCRIVDVVTSYHDARGQHAPVHVKEVNERRSEAMNKRETSPP
jgi:hypothetical protein